MEIVQNSWLKTGKKLRTYWPTKYNGRDINDIVQDDESIAENSYGWKDYAIHILYACGKFLFHF